MLDDQGRAVRDGDGGAAVSGQSAAAGRSAIHGEPANHRRCELADAALSAGNRAERPRALGERADAGAGTRDSARAGRKTAPKERTAGGDVRGGAAGIPEGGAFLPAGESADAAGG